MRKLLISYLSSVAAVVTIAYSLWNGPLGLANIILISAIAGWAVITALYFWKKDWFQFFSFFFPNELNTASVYARLTLLFAIIALMGIVTIVGHIINPINPPDPKPMVADQGLEDWEKLRAQKDSLVNFTNGLEFGDTLIKSATKMQIDAIYLQRLVKDELDIPFFSVLLESGDTVKINSCQDLEQLKISSNYAFTDRAAAFRKDILAINCQILMLGKRRKTAQQSYFDSRNMFNTEQWPIHLLKSINPKIRQAITKDALAALTFKDWLNKDQLSIDNINDDGVIFGFGREQVFFTEVMQGDFNGDNIKDVVLLRTSSVNRGSAQNIELLLLTKLSKDRPFEVI